MDASDNVDFEVDCSPVLEEGETITSYTLTIPAESALFGLELGTGIKEDAINENIIQFWLSLNNPSLVTDLITLPIQITLNTSNQRTRQRTVAVKVDQL